MPSYSKRSKEERDLYYIDNTLPRESDAIKVITLPPPEKIQDNELKLEIWKYLCADLASRELLSPSYTVSLTILCENIYTYNDYSKLLEDTGALVPIMAKNGESVIRYEANPLFGMVKAVERTILKLCEKFGLNPRDAIYVTNPDIKTRTIESSAKDPKKGITYFA